VRVVWEKKGETPCVVLLMLLTLDWMLARCGKC